MELGRTAVAVTSMTAIASALPALIGTILGVCVYVQYLPGWTGLVLAFVGLLIAIIGRSLLSSRPVLASHLAVFWILVGIGLVGYCSFGLLWLALHLEILLPKSDAATLKEVSAAISGAAIAFAGAVLMKDFGDGKGFFWPGAFFRKGVEQVFGHSQLRPERDTKAYEAVWNDRVRGGPKGWGYRARLERARILDRHLASLGYDAGQSNGITVNTRNSEAAVFLAHMVWILGAFLVVLCAKIWGAITTFLPVSLLFLSDLTYSECLSASLSLLVIPLVLLHAAMQLYQRYTIDVERFPGQLGPYRIPEQLRYIRVFLFIVLVFAPTFSYAFFVGRMFTHLTIVWHGDEHLPDPRIAPNSKNGLHLITDWGTHADGSFGGPFEGGWRWWAWQDYRPSYGTLDEKGERTAKTPHPGVWPGLAPSFYTMVTLAMTSALSLLILRRLPRRSMGGD
jgi:uncharacterized membrane protein